MLTPKQTEKATHLADLAEQTAENAIQATQRVANEALDSLADGVQEVRHQTTPLLNRAAEQASALAQRGMDSLRDASQRLHDKAESASDSVVTCIRKEPVKAMLIAGATGAALMALSSLISRSRDRG